MENVEQLSRTLSFALRHRPWEYGLTLDNEGWVDLAKLIENLRKIPAFTSLSQSDIEETIALSEKKRHEIANGKIRAVYGHSIKEKILRKLKRNNLTSAGISYLVPKNQRE